MASRFYNFNSPTTTIKRWQLSAPAKQTCTEEWLQKAKESQQRIAKKYIKYSVRRDV